MNNEEKWFEREGIVYFSVTSNGLTGEEWIKRLEEKGFNVADYAADVILSKDFKPTSGITYEIAVLKGELFELDQRLTKIIREDAKKRKLTTPNAEIACLIREKFTDKEVEAMGPCRIIVMHEPIRDSDGDLSLLRVNWNGSGLWLVTLPGGSNCKWCLGDSFAFVVSQTSNS